MTRQELFAEAEKYKAAALTISRLSDALDDETLGDISTIFLGYTQCIKIVLRHSAANSVLPRTLVHMFGLGTKSRFAGDEGLRVYYKAREGELAIEVQRYLGPTCRLIEETYVERVPKLVETGEFEEIKRTRRRVVCDENEK